MAESRKGKGSTGGGKRQRSKVRSDELMEQPVPVAVPVAPDATRAALSSLRDTLEAEGHGEFAGGGQHDELFTLPGTLGPAATNASEQAEAAATATGLLAATCVASQNQGECVVPGAIRAEVQLLATSLVTFGRQLQALQQKQLEHATSSREDMVHMLSKFDALQHLCRDTAAMGMQHAEAVLGMGLRLEVLEKQVAPLLDEKFQDSSKVDVNDSKGLSEPSAGMPIFSLQLPEPAESQVARSASGTALSEIEPIKAASNGNDALLGGASARSTSSSVATRLELSKAYANDLDLPMAPMKRQGSNSGVESSFDALKQQYSETARKVFGQVSSIETRMDKLEEHIGAQVRRAVEDICNSREAQGLSTKGLNSSGTDSWNAVQADLVKQVEGLLNHVTQVEGLLQPSAPTQALAAGNRRVFSPPHGHKRRASQPVTSPRVVSRTTSPMPVGSAVSRNSSLQVRNTSVPPAAVQRMRSATSLSGSFPTGGSLTAKASSPPSTPMTPQLRGRQVDPVWVMMSNAGSSNTSRPPLGPPFADLSSPTSPEHTSPPNAWRASLRQRLGSAAAVNQVPTVRPAGPEGKVQNLIQHWSITNMSPSRTTTPLRQAHTTAGSLTLPSSALVTPGVPTVSSPTLSSPAS